MASSDAGGAIAAVLFDLDGTFADTLPDLAAALGAAGAARGAAPLDLGGAPHLVSSGGRRMVAETLGLPEDHPAVDEVRRDFLRRYRAGIAERSRPFPGIEQVIGEIERRGLRWGIVTNKHGWLTEPLVEALGYARRAGCVVSGDSVPRPKPHPDPLLQAARALGLPPGACVYLGDAPNDVTAARAAGMAALVAGWGYLPPPYRTGGWGADATLASPAALFDWIEARGAAPRRAGSGR